MILYIVSSSVCFPVISLVTGEPMSVLITGNIFTRICSILIARLLLVILIWAAMIQKKKQKKKIMAGVAVNFTDSDCGGIYPD